LSEHLTKTQIEDYGRHTVSAAEFLSAAKHLRDCEECRQKAERVLYDDEMFYALRSEVFGASVETFSSSAEQAHLTFERTAAYIDEALSGKALQLVKDHIASCEQCAMAVDDLRAFRNRVTPGLNREYQPPHAGSLSVERNPMPKRLDMIQEGFDRLLAWLHSDRNLAGEKYVIIRRGLAQFFERRGCIEPDELADEAIDRVIKKLPEIADQYTGEQAKYFYGVARHVYQECLSRPRGVHSVGKSMNAQDNEKLFYRVLLGEALPDEQERIEIRLLEDDELQEVIESAEFDLIDDYIRGKLTAEEVRSFEQNFLNSPARRRKLEMARVRLKSNVEIDSDS
jgi:hypothetical protein